MFWRRLTVTWLLMVGGCYDIDSLSRNPPQDLLGPIDASVADLAHDFDLEPHFDLAHDFATPADLRPPPAEICDGIDNNFNGRADEGCPNGVLLGNEMSGTLVGSATGGMQYASVDHCPAGSVVVGFRVHAGTTDCGITIAQICAPLAEVELKSAVPYTYAMTTTTPTTDGLAHGTGAGLGAPSAAPTTALLCPAGSVGYGIFLGSQAGGAGAIAIWCANLVVSQSDFSVQLQSGAVTSVVAGPLYNMAPCAPAVGATSFCPNNQVLVGINGRGESLVYALQPVCRTPSFTLRP